MGCGETEEDVCERVRDLQKEMCEDSELCFPCSCIFKGQDYEIILDFIELPDFRLSGCLERSEPCSGQKKENAEACIDDIATCDPRYYITGIGDGAVKLFDHGQAEPAFRLACGSQWE